MTESPLGRVLATGVSVLLACTASLVARSMPDASPPAGASSGRLVVGRDVSWPNCPKGLGMPSRRTQGKPMPPRSARFVVIGLTNGPAFHPNPCLAAQVDHARSRHLWAAAYAVLTYPTTGQLRTYGGPRAAGRAQAEQNVAAMQAVGLRAPLVWVDIEPVSPPAPWSRRVPANRAVLAGALTAYRRAGLRVGFYSTPSMWRSIVGPVRPGLPEWRTAGLASRSAALARCSRRDSFQGGPAVLTQWYSLREDFDVLCPGRAADAVLAEYFTRL